MWGSDSDDVRKKAGVTLIANNCEIVGDVHFTDELHVNGVVKGNVVAEHASKARANISEHGRVEGEIRVPTVVINGEVVGDIHSDKHIELSAKARVKGSVYYHLIEMVLGAQVDGKLVHVDPARQGERVGELAGPRRIEPDEQRANTEGVVQPVARG